MEEREEKMERKKCLTGMRKHRGKYETLKGNKKMRKMETKGGEKDGEEEDAEGRKE